MLGWYPGHMHKARRQIQEALPEIDVAIEVLDARLPYSSANPMLAELTRHTPVLKILSRADLADPERTREWVAHFDAQPDTRALAITTTQARELKRIPKLCHELAGAVRADRDVRVMVMGIPNVGKSTLINGLAGRTLAKTGNEPAVTKRQQKVRINGRVALIDTPGVLWPKIEDQASAYRLAASGAIRDTAIDYIDVGMVTAAELAKRYPDALKSRYKLKVLPPTAPIPRRSGWRPTARRGWTYWPWRASTAMRYWPRSPPGAAACARAAKWTCTAAPRYCSTSCATASWAG